MLGVAFELNGMFDFVVGVLDVLLGEKDDAPFLHLLFPLLQVRRKVLVTCAISRLKFAVKKTLLQVWRKLNLCWILWLGLVVEKT